MKRLARNLRDASFDAFILGLETVNRPSVAYRLQAAAILFSNAWELLLKAKLVASGQKIFFRKKRGKSRRSLPLDQCIGRILTDVNDPLRLNVEALAELRDHAAHFVVPFIPHDVMGLFQATVVNYSRKLNEWFQVSVSQRVPVGMMALVYCRAPLEIWTGKIGQEGAWKRE